MRKFDFDNIDLAIIAITVILLLTLPIAFWKATTEAALSIGGMGITAIAALGKGRNNGQ